MARIENTMDMKTYEKLVDALDSNTQIEDNIKAQILLLAIEFYNRFSKVPLDNFYERLKGVNILGGSKYLYNTAIQYFPKTNEIIINKEMLAKDETDIYHSMMKVILSMVTAKDDYYGFAGNKDLEALNVGFCDMVARALVGNEGVSDNEFELENDKISDEIRGNMPFIGSIGTVKPNNALSKIESVVKETEDVILPNLGLVDDVKSDVPIVGENYIN